MQAAETPQGRSTMIDEIRVKLDESTTTRVPVTWDPSAHRYIVGGNQLMKTLGYVYSVGVGADGEPLPTSTVSAAYGQAVTRQLPAKYVYQAADSTGVDIGEPVDSKLAAAQLIVDAASV